MKRALTPALLIGVALAFAAPQPAAGAEEPLSGYSSPTPPPPTTPPPTTPPPTTPPHEPPATTPEAHRPEAEEAHKPEVGEREPTPVAAPPARSAKLPFTGWDLRRQGGFALLLIAAGSGILVLQRRRRRVDRARPGRSSGE